MSMQDHLDGTMPAGTVQSAMDTLPIYEVARELGLAQHVMRMWETRFPQLRPLRGQGGRRSYRAHDIAVLRRIADLLYVQKLSLAQAQAELARAQLTDSTLSTPVLEVAHPVVESGVPEQPATPPAIAAPEAAPHAEAQPPHPRIEPPPEGPAPEPASVVVVEQVTAVAEVDYSVAVEDMSPAIAEPAVSEPDTAAQPPVMESSVVTDEGAVADAAPSTEQEEELPLEQLVMIELERLQAENTVLRDSLRGVLVELQALREMVPV
ncbi:MerR family transcriptional regulator [Komagataeibacter medellinensis]|uniref:MerR family transcriptional regulator n=1 Tax=Komagataeibacter medellinensis TaxID=1177712 RepID=A0ABQ6VX98_9PROT|nr:MerR family transcriptional regulator [Komagataeibacter medellinensis]KAB8124805.1 MerR family transcriptional regulator [Komagataeibacter medellinensis]